MQLWGLWVALAARARPRLLLRTEHARTQQPVRCALQVCKPFEADCGGDNECVTDKCYEGKCGLGATCDAHGELCFVDSQHTCCTGACNPVQLRSDCVKLLGLDSGEAAQQGAYGINVDRQCMHLGVCGHWPGALKAPSVLTTPWAVDATDNPAKYYALSSLTFKEGTHLNVAQTVARKVGSIAAGVSPKATRPRAVADAGVLHFTAGSRVAREISMPYKMGDTTFCIAPILQDGEGGAFYAVGKDCCTEEAFECGDKEADVAGPAGVIVQSEVNQFAQARQLLEVAKGTMYHDDTRGVQTDAPMYVWWSKDPEAEQVARPTSSGLQYVVPIGNTTFCTVPIGTGYNFFAVGQNCCETGTSFTCGGASDPAARSGALAIDQTGDYVQAMKQGEYLFGYKANAKPIYLDWTAETLVTAPA